MPKHETIESPLEDRDLQRMVADIQNTVKRMTDGAEQTAAVLQQVAEAILSSGASPIAPGSYNRDTLPPLGERGQALLDSIWEAGERNAGPRTAEKAKRGGRSRTARGRLKLTDRGGDSVLEHLAKR